MNKRLLFSTCCLFVSGSVLANITDTIDDPCGGPNSLLNLVDRPTISSSPCTVPFKQVVLEMGYQHENLTDNAGHAQDFVQPEFRIGLPARTELTLFPPNYTRQTMTPTNGFWPTSVGLKHEIGHNADWIGTLQGIVITPSGSNGFGSHGTGFIFNGIATYTISPAWNILLMLGGSSITTSTFSGGDRFESINPDVVLTYSILPKINLYGEAYGQSKTGPGESSGFNWDGGLICLPLQFLEADVEYGQRISGNLGGFNHYIGAGLSVLFG